MHEAVANHFSLAVERRRLALPDEPEPGAFLAHQGERSAADRRQRSRDDEPARRAGPDGLGPARRGPSQRAGMRAASCTSTRSTRRCLPRWPIRRCRRSTRTRRCSSTATSSTATMAGWPSRRRASAARKLLSDPKVKVMVMGNHGILVIGDTVADTFNRMYYFERAAETYIKALWTGRPLRVLSDEVAEKTAREMDDYPGPGRAAPRRTQGDPRRAGAGLPELSRRLSAEPQIGAHCFGAVGDRTRRPARAVGDFRPEYGAHPGREARQCCPGGCLP